MYDRPEIEELLEAVIGHLSHEVVPTIKSNRKLYFQTLVANNLLKIVSRDLKHREQHQISEWTRLNNLQGQHVELPTDSVRLALQERNKMLCLEIQNGTYDEPATKQALFEHLVQSTQEQLIVANPNYLASLVEKD